jgi:hypothetical protein
MTALMREIQAAYFLGYNEMSDFRAAVKSGDAPQPTRKIKSGRRSVDAWSRRALEEWIENSGEERKPSLSNAIERLAG